MVQSISFLSTQIYIFHPRGKFSTILISLTKSKTGQHNKLIKQFKNIKSYQYFSVSISIHVSHRWYLEKIFAEIMDQEKIGRNQKKFNFFTNPTHTHNNNKHVSRYLHKWPRVSFVVWALGGAGGPQEGRGWRGRPPARGVRPPGPLSIPGPRHQLAHPVPTLVWDTDILQ